MCPAKSSSSPDYGEVAIRQALTTRVIGHDLIFLQSTTSTNVIAKKRGRKGCVEGLVVVADHQRSGKGRMGRRWSAPAGADVLMSIVLRPQMSPEVCAKLTGMACLAVAKTIETCHGLQPQVKWPNDVLIDGRKVCGILTEGQVREHRLAFAVVGIGINANREQKTFRKPVSQTASSLLIALGHPVDRTKLLAKVLHNLEVEYMQLKSSGFSGIVPELRRRLSHLDRDITVRTGESETRGRCLGLDDESRLIVQESNGTRHAFWGGEILRVR